LRLDDLVTNPLEIVLESDRLRLVSTSEAYAQTIFSEFTPDITTYMFPRPPDEIEETHAFVRDSRLKMANGGELNMAVLLRTTDEFLGHAGLHHIDSDTPELGVWIKKSAHGLGYGREAITVLTHWAFANLRVRYLIYPVDRRNLPSRKIPESLDGVVEAKYERVNQSGRTLDLLEYRIYPL
jgi:ribosomal-protein-alanine N-acetyltransferase